MSPQRPTESRLEAPEIGGAAPNSHDNTEAPHSEMLDDWSRRVQVSIYAHNSAEVHFARRDAFVAGVLIGGTVLLGQIAIVASTKAAFPKAIIAVVTVLIALTGALGLVWDFRAKAIQHRFAARQYGAIRRSIELLHRIDPDSPEAGWRRDEIRRQWDAASATAPSVPMKLRTAAQNAYQARLGA